MRLLFCALHGATPRRNRRLLCPQEQGEGSTKKAEAPFVCCDRVSRMLMQQELLLIHRKCLKWRSKTQFSLKTNFCWTVQSLTEIFEEAVIELELMGKGCGLELRGAGEGGADWGQVKGDLGSTAEVISGGGDGGRTQSCLLESKEVCCCRTRCGWRQETVMLVGPNGGTTCSSDLQPSARGGDGSRLWWWQGGSWQSQRGILALCTCPVTPVEWLGHGVRKKL